jgi:hypothetical protein
LVDCHSTSVEPQSTSVEWQNTSADLHSDLSDWQTDRVDWQTTCPFSLKTPDFCQIWRFLDSFTPVDGKNQCSDENSPAFQGWDAGAQLPKVLQGRQAGSFVPPGLWVLRDNKPTTQVLGYFQKPT